MCGNWVLGRVARDYEGCVEYVGESYEHGICIHPVCYQKTYGCIGGVRQAMYSDIEIGDKIESLFK